MRLRSSSSINDAPAWSKVARVLSGVFVASSSLLLSSLEEKSAGLYTESRAVRPSVVKRWAAGAHAPTPPTSAAASERSEILDMLTRQTALLGVCVLVSSFLKRKQIDRLVRYYGS
jgi:hypothetical protein